MLKSSKLGLNDISLRSNIIINIIMVIISLICIIPVILVIVVSFTDETVLLNEGYTFLPSRWSTNAYKYLFYDPSKILRGYGITIFVTIVGTLLGLLVTSLFAYPISRKDFKYKKQFSFFVFFTMLFNGGLVPWYLVYVRGLHMKNTIWVLIIPYLVIPWFVLLMRTFFSTTIPVSVLESAKIDGAGEFKIFFKIVVPLSLPAFATIGLFYTLMYWNDWWLSMVFITKDELVNLQYLLYKTLMNVLYLANSDLASTGHAESQLSKMPSESARMAMCIIGVGPIIFAYPFFQKYFVSGLTVGAVKG